MIPDAKIKESVQQTTLQAEEEQEFNWRYYWYPTCFQQDLPIKLPYSFSLYDEPFVLFRNKDGELTCLTDRCPVGVLQS